jgi:Fe2+ transport system protein FeoA
MTTSCPLCGFVYEPGGDACRTSGCPFATSSCRKLHCPRCGYSVPDENASVVARFVRRLFAGNTPPTVRADAGPRRLSDLPAGTRATIERIEGSATLAAQLSAQGLVAGTALDLKQRRPCFVVEMGETTLALERSVAAGIWVRPGAEA